MDRDYWVTLTIDAHGTPESVAQELREYAAQAADYEIRVREYQKRDWGFDIDPEYPEGPLAWEPMVIGDRVSYYVNSLLTGEVVLVGSSRQCYQYALPMVAVKWDGLPAERLVDNPHPTPEALGQISVVPRSELRIIQKIKEEDRRGGIQQA